MKNFFSAFLWFLVLAFTAFLFHYFIGENLCGVCTTSQVQNGQEQGEATPVTPSNVQFTEFAITDTAGKVIYKFPRGFVIGSRDATVEIPAALAGVKDSIFNYLNLHQGKELLISAKYLKSEGETRGIDRAAFLKKILVTSGVNPDRIIPKAVLSDFSYENDEKYNDGIALLFQNIPEKQLQIIEATIRDKTLYAAYASTNFKPDKTLQAYAFELKNYLEKYPDKKVYVTGHTDNKGKAKSNYILGLKRAQNVVKYLISQGVVKSKIKAYSKGETEPVASNDTEDGQAANRRIHIVIK